jgi:hypothetical protein
MSHAYAARGPRRTAVFTAIAAFRYVLIVVIATGLGPRLLMLVLSVLPNASLAPQKYPRPVRELPDVNFVNVAFEISVGASVLDLPQFDATESVPGAAPESTAAAGSTTSSPVAHVEPVAPSLGTRSGSFTDVIGSCYPAPSRRLNEEGRVVALVMIVAKGAAVHWSLEFVAGRPDGQAVAAEATLRIIFRLDRPCYWRSGLCYADAAPQARPAGPVLAVESANR